MVNPVYRPYTHPIIQGEKKSPIKPNSNTQSSFASELYSALQPQKDQLTISKHAQQRLDQRGIHINEERWEKIGEKVKEAKRMGVNESLVLLKDAALIVSAKNQTVITAMDRQDANAQIFTNINGTILMD